ncbi:MAG: aldo/keto reductase, partial [Candidatus Bathyarchaeia archaeon]
MEKRSLGRTGLKVSVVGFGGIPIIARSRAEAEKVVRYAYERGITYFDTARYYGDSEEKIGAALKDVRDDVVLATKTIQRTREGAAKDLKQSFRNLQTDRVDIVQLHMIESEEELARVTISDGVLNALKEARSQGKIDYIGITGHNPYILAKAIMTGEFDTVQVPLNVLERRALEGLIPVARKLNVGVVIMKPLGGCGTPPLQYPQRGVWFLGRPELDWPDTSEFITYFGRDGLERAQRCLRFILAHDVD